MAIKSVAYIAFTFESREYSKGREKPKYYYKPNNAAKILKSQSASAISERGEGGAERYSRDKDY